MNIVELFARIGVKADQDKAEKFLGTVKGIKIGLAAAAAGATAFTYAIKKITDESFAAALEIKKLQDSTGASAESLQKWQAVADQVSGSGQAVAASIRAIASNQEKIKLGQGNISGYNLLGIDPRQDPFEVLEQIKQKTQGLSQAMKRNIMEQMGVSGDLISTLELTNDQFDQMAGRAWIIPQSQIDSLNKTRASLVEVGQAVKYMKSLIATQLAPKILEITRASLAWVRANKDGLVKGIKTIFDLIAKFVIAIFRAGTMIGSLISNTLGWANALKIVVGIIAVLNAAFLMSPLGLFIAGIVLLVAVLDDLYVYSKGGKSMFGVFIEKFPALGKVFENVAGIVKDLLSAIGAIMDGDWSKFDDIMSKWGLLGVIIKGIVDSLKWLMTGFKFPGELSNFIDTTKEKGFGAALKEDWNKSVEIWKNQAADIGGFFKNLISGQVQTAPAGGGTVINQNVYGSTDPEATGKAAARQLETTLKDTRVQRSTGKKALQ